MSLCVYASPHLLLLPEPLSFIFLPSCLCVSLCFSCSSPNALSSLYFQVVASFGICGAFLRITGSVGLVRRALGPVAVGGLLPKEGGAHGGRDWP